MANIAYTTSGRMLNMWTVGSIEGLNACLTFVSIHTEALGRLLTVGEVIKPLLDRDINM